MSCVMCHVSHIMCHVSPVTCHVSPVTCHMSKNMLHVLNKENIYIYPSEKFDKVVELVGGGSVINGAYPV